MRTSLLAMLAPARQFGRMEASKGRWSVKSAVWADEGSSKLADAKTWIVTGRGGTATWRGSAASLRTRASGGSDILSYP